RLLDELCRLHGDKPYALMERRHVIDIRDEKAAAPEAANARVKALRTLFGWALDKGYVTSNPAREVPRHDPHNADGHHTWSRQEVEQYEAKHPLGTKARAALALF